MKNIILSITLLVSYGPLSSNTYAIPDPGYAELVYNKLVVSQRLPKHANLYLDRIAKTRREVPTHIWTNIKQSLDYSKFKKAVIKILNDNYTDVELRGMLFNPEYTKNIPLTLDLRNKIQLAAEAFSPDLVNQTNSILVSNGYRRLN